MYNKLFTRILDSSIWLENHATRIVWVAMLASMDEDGYCHFASIGNVAQRAVVSREEAEKAIGILESPDSDSSDPAHEGRRIERVPGGWMVLNAPKYRELATREHSKVQTRERVKRFREKRNADVTPSNDSVTTSEAYTETEIEAEEGEEVQIYRPQIDVLPVTSDLPQPGLHELEYARYFWEELGMPTSKQHLEIAGQAIKNYAKTENSPMHIVVVTLLARAQIARDSGATINRFWFEDGKHTGKGVGDGLSKTEQRNQRNRVNLEAGLRAFCGDSALDGVGIPITESRDIPRANAPVVISSKALPPRRD